MGRKLHLKPLRDTADHQWDTDRILAEALAEKAAFLQKHPQHMKYQAEIDAILEKAGTPENRMTVLAMLMEGKLIELQKELKTLNRILLRATA